MSIETTRWDVQDYLRTPEDCALFILAAIDEAGDDPAFIAKVLQEVARARDRAKKSPSNRSREGLLGKHQTS